MEWINKLKNVLEIAIKEDELPDNLANKIKGIIANPKKFYHKSKLIEKLIEQITDYDAYANAGCFSNSYSADDIEATLEEILK